MKRMKSKKIAGITAFLFFLFSMQPLFADDTCIFTVSASDVKPNIVLLLDNGAEMEQIAWHSSFDNNTDYTPNVTNAWDVIDAAASGSSPTPATSNTTLVLNNLDESYPFAVGSDVEGQTSGATANVVSKNYPGGGSLNLEIDNITGTFVVGETVQRYKNINNIATGDITQIDTPAASSESGSSTPSSPNGFFNDNGYGVVGHGGSLYIVKVLSNLELDSYTNGLEADSGNTWIINGKTITLPSDPSSSAVSVTTVAGTYSVKDNATLFRYSKNYLNWLFFATDGSGSALYSGNGSDLPDVSRFYYAKLAIMTVARATANKAYLAIYNFVATTEGASSVQPLGLVLSSVDSANYTNNVLDSSFENNINNMETVTHSTLAEGLAYVGAYYDSPSSGVVSEYCQDQFVVVITPGLSSEDQTGHSTYLPTTLSDYDGDNGTGGITEGKIQADSTLFDIPVNYNGSTWLDDVAYYMYTNDMVGYQTGFQKVSTYTVGFMGNRESNLFLINTSNNGNGYQNLYDTTDSHYGKFHFEAESPDGLAAAILNAVNSILSRTSTFTAPVVPVTRTTSGNRIYMALFKPMEGNFWQGNVVKFGLSLANEIIDVDGNIATWPNGSIKASARPYWSTLNWSDADYASPVCTGDSCNYIDNSARNIYTYLGENTALTHSSNEFDTSNSFLTAAVMGQPTQGLNTIINFVRGADALDEDGDSDISENRSFITGDVLHSEPAVFQYKYEGSAGNPDTGKTYVFFGANDGMLHAVKDEVDPDLDTSNDESNYGTESWAFIPPGQLSRLKNMVEGAGHEVYVDASPKIYFNDVNGDGFINDINGNNVVDTGDDQIILVCGERGGGTGYFALDITYPTAPIFLWRIDQSNGFDSGALKLFGSSIYRNSGGSFQINDTLRIYNGTGWDDYATADSGESTDGTDIFISYKNQILPFQLNRYVGNLTTADYEDWKDLASSAPPFVWGQIIGIYPPNPTTIISQLGNTWSEPQFGKVKTSSSDTTGTLVFFIGGGYDATNSSGNAILAINALTGTVVKMWSTAATSSTNINTPSMTYSIPSTIRILDSDYNGFIDKVYVGDMGSQLWRVGRFTDYSGTALTFPDIDENINNWTAQILLSADGANQRKFFYPPSVTYEKGFDLIFAGTGDREEACTITTYADRIYAIKDQHGSTTFDETDLVDLTSESATTPVLSNDSGDVDNNGIADNGWYIRLVDASGNPAGEKVLAGNTVFYKTLYASTFTPNNDPCTPGGDGRMYALNYLTGAAVLSFGSDNDGDGLEDKERGISLGGGIPSKPVMVLTELGQKLFFSVGSTSPDANSESTEAGIIAIDPSAPPINFFYLWWQQLFN